MLRRTTALKNKKNTGLKKTGGLSKTKSLMKKAILKTQLKENKLLCKTELKKQNETAKVNWEIARTFALIRDGYKCQVCGKKATQVHHIHLRSKRKDLLYHLNNLISICARHHIHSGSEKYKEQTELIATSKNMTTEELLKFAES